MTFQVVKIEVGSLSVAMFTFQSVNLREHIGGNGKPRLPKGIQTYLVLLALFREPEQVSV